MITYYAIASNGDIAKIRLKNWDWVNYSILNLYESAELLGFIYFFISKDEFKMLKKSRKVYGGGRLKNEGEYVGNWIEYR